MRVVVVVVLALAGCVQSSSRHCGNGVVCPEGQSCAQVGDPAQTLCVTDEQTAACNGIDEGMACADSPAATCHGGACFVDVCGNELRDASEACDDGNTTSGDGCSDTCASTEVCTNGVTDRGEQCDPGDALGHDGCTSSCEFELLQWSAVLDDVPSFRYAAAAAYDTDRGAIVVFGGNGTSTGVPVERDTMFTWDGIRWHRDQPFIQPSARAEHAMAYDAFHHELVLFGGLNNPDETWTAQGTSWTLRNSVTHPPVDARPAMVYEAAKHRVIMVYNSGTWAWDGTDWKELPQADIETTRGYASLAYDPKRGVVVMFAGRPKSGTGVVNDTWELSGDTWVKKVPTASPPPRMRAAAAFSPANQEVMIIGGYNGVDDLHDAWTWDGTRWQQVADPPYMGTPTGDSASMYRWATAAADPERGRLIVLSSYGLVVEWGQGPTGLAWTIPPKGFTNRIVPPQPSIWNAAVSDPRNRRLVMYGGFTSTNQPLDETWWWDGQWNYADGPGSARYGASLVYDARRDQYVMYGGCTSATAFDETWTVAIDDQQFVATWTPQATSGTRPPGRCFATMVYDPATGNTLLFGGRDSLQNPKNDFWMWNGSTWTQLTPSSLPPARYWAAGGFDPIYHELVVFSGASATATLDDAWVWNGTAWTKLATPSPPSRVQAQMAWDAARQRLVMFGGGKNGGISLEDVWEFNAADHTWTYQPVGSLTRTGHALVPAFDQRGGVIMVNGSGDGVYRAELMHLTRIGDTSYETCRSNDADGDALVGCADPDCWSLCTPSCPPGTDCTGQLALCGNGTCDPGLEQCTTCPTDCMACAAVCGNVRCDAAAGETQASCPGDCTP